VGFKEPISFRDKWDDFRLTKQNSKIFNDFIKITLVAVYDPF